MFRHASLQAEPLSLSLAFLAALAAFMLWKTANSSLGTVPGPKYTLFTRIPHIYHQLMGTRRLWVHNLHQRYGTVVRVAPDEVSFASATAAGTIYSVKNGGYRKTDLYDMFRQLGHRNLFTHKDKNEHQKTKKRLAEVYSNTFITQGGPLPHFKNRTRAFVQQIAQQPDMIMDVYRYLHCFALDNITAVLFHPHGLETTEGESLVDALSYDGSGRELILQHHFPTLFNLAGRVCSLFLRKTTNRSPVESYVLETIMNQSNGSIPPFSPFTVARRLCDHPDGLDLNAIASECLDHLGAGVETTGDTLTFLMHALSLPHNTEIQATLRRELVGHVLSCGGDGDVALDGLDKLPYLNAVIKEALRVFAPSAMSLPRLVPEGGHVVDGVWLPGGTVVSAQAWTLHRLDETVWEDDAGFFRPERWLCGDPEKMKEMERLWFAFGGGSRVCIGRHLAMVEMRLLLAAVYTQFRTACVAGEPSKLGMEETLLTVRPEGLRCRLQFFSLSD